MHTILSSVTVSRFAFPVVDRRMRIRRRAISCKIALHYIERTCIKPRSREFVVLPRGRH